MLTKTSTVGVIFSTMLSLMPLSAAAVPVVDATGWLTWARQEVKWAEQALSWYQQASDMVKSITEAQNTVKGVKANLDNLSGKKILGLANINPNVWLKLPPEMKDASDLLVRAGQVRSNPTAIADVLRKFAVKTTVIPSAGQAAADQYLKMNLLLQSTQQRTNEIYDLSSAINSTEDAKSAMDLISRNSLQNAKITNDLIQTMAMVEANKQAVEMSNLASDQAAQALRLQRVNYRFSAIP